jgi:hypothetical protein
MYLSYSGRKTYLTCPRQYEFRYVLKDPARSDPKKSMLGSAIGKVFEWFYDQKMWAEKDPEALALSKIPDAIEYTFAHENYMPGSDYTWESSLKSDLREFIPKGIGVIRTHGFVTPYSRAEVDLTVNYSPPGSKISVKMGGRSDFIHGQTLSDVWIVDGKASKHREKYVDADQLVWYGTQHYIKYHVAPSRLGFVFWCFPDDPVKWIEFDRDSMRGLVKSLFEVCQRILDKDFQATPSGECHRCAYKGKCDDGTVYLAKRRVETGGRIDESDLLDVERL